MARQQPTDIDLFFLVGAILIFLMINYSMPLATIYTAMVLLGAMMYLVPIQFNFFRWIPIIKPGNKLPKILVGALFGFGFIMLYSSISDTPMAAVFATTLFGESEVMTKLVYSGLIPPVESVFFFVTLLTWWAWKIGDNVLTVPAFSFTGIKLMVIFGAVFVLFHATAKGLENTGDLFATFLFGAISVGMILHFKEAIQAIIMHVVVNAKAMGIFESIQGAAASGSSMLTILAVVVVVYLITSQKPVRVFT